ncbi:MAG: aminotransferase class IV [Thermodesulfobacteriota bacterium]
MKQEAILDYYSVNGELRSTGKTEIFDRIGGRAIYEVVKLIDGVPLFFEEHMARMRRSAALLGVSLDTREADILTDIRRLSEKNRCRHINVKLVSAHPDGEDLFLIYFIKSEYPGPEVYARGVHTILFSGERENPHIKTLAGSFRQRVEKARQETGAYEALLVDGDGYIAEGTRSNIFFLQETGIYTPPAGTVLLGVTRGQVVDICEGLSIPVTEQPLCTDDLKTLKGAFITGTTVDVLPIASIGEIRIPSVSAPAIQSIIQVFREKMRADIHRRGGDPTRIDSESDRSLSPRRPPGCPG